MRYLSKSVAKGQIGEVCPIGVKITFIWLRESVNHWNSGPDVLITTCLKELEKTQGKDKATLSLTQHHENKKPSSVLII